LVYMQINTLIFWFDNVYYNAQFVVIMYNKTYINR
jgi:hypothetical protein